MGRRVFGPWRAFPELAEYVNDPDRFRGFFAGDGNRTYIPNQFLDDVVTTESLAVAKVVGAVVRFSIGFANRWGHRRTLTFGCFNNFSKVTAPMLQLWARILQTMPDSTLLLKGVALADGSTRQHIRDLMQSQGIAAGRLELLGHKPLHADHLVLYSQMDIALDTFPYHGTTTTCEALWMGVPVVSLAGQSHVSRVGVSLLSNVGQPELIAHTPDQYVQIAAALANDLHRLAELRATLRSRMEQSALMDAPRFARNIEAAYRQMWTQWCCLG